MKQTRHETLRQQQKRLAEDALTNLEHAAEGLSNVHGVRASGIVVVLEALIERAKALIDELT